MARLRELALEAYDKLIGPELSEVAIHCCITKAPFGGEKAGRNPADRGKRGIKRSVVVDAEGIPLEVVTAPANRHDSPVLEETLAAVDELGSMLEQMSVYLDRGYDSDLTRERLEGHGLIGVISEKAEPAPLQAT